MIANTFFRAGLIEAWGRGTLRIVNDCKLAGAPIPTFQYNFSGFIVEFDLKSLDKTSDKPSDKTSDKPSDKTSDKILEFIKEQPKTTIKALAEIMGVSTRAIEIHLQNLKQNHKIIRNGGKKTGNWEVL